MNNLYKRPMFRKGGSAEGGITSGLQAPRPGYRWTGAMRIETWIKMYGSIFNKTQSW